MALEVKISGTTYQVENTFQIRQQAGAISTSQITVSLGSNPRPQALQSVQILIDSIPVFSGIINQVAGPEQFTGFEDSATTLTLQSLEVILSWRLVSQNFYNKYIHEIVQWIFDNLIAPEGISLGQISATTIRISKYKKAGDKVSSVLDDLAKRIDGCTYYIGPDKKFYFLVRSDFLEVNAPEHITEVKLIEGYGDLRTVQTVKGSSSTIAGTAENTSLQQALASLNGTSGRIEAQESDSDLHSDTSAAAKAQNLLEQFAEREKTITLTCHDLATSQLYRAWIFAGVKFPAEITGTFVVTERTIIGFGPDAYSITVCLKNRNYFARYGYTLKTVQQTALSSVAAIADIASDGRFSPVEKISARAKWNLIVAEVPTFDAQAVEYGITVRKAAYDAAFQALADYLNGGTTWSSGFPLWLASSEISVTEDIDSEEFEEKWATYEAAKIALAADITSGARIAAQEYTDSQLETVSHVFFDQPVGPYKRGDLWIHDGALYQSIADRGVGEFVAGDWFWSIRANLTAVVESTNGDKFRPGQSATTTLIARVFKNGLEITSTLPDSAFKWTRKSFFEPNTDATWNSNHSTGYRTVEVTTDTIDARATYTLEILE